MQKSGREFAFENLTTTFAKKFKITNYVLDARISIVC